MELPKRKPTRMKGFDYGSNGKYFITICTKEKKKYCVASSRTPSPTNAKIPHIISTFKRFCNKAAGESVFQRSFHDHIIRNEKDYRKIYEYIESNPSIWIEDCFYKENL